MLWYLLIGFGSIIIIWFFVYLKRKQDQTEENFQKRFSGKNIRLLDKYAMFIAQESDGYSHFRGMGYLVLTDDELYFERQLGNKVIPLPITSIVQVGDTKRLGGQNPGKTMLKISFKDNNGENDSIALCVKELAQWKKEIAAAIDEKSITKRI